jgi:hypothetical protein
MVQEPKRDRVYRIARRDIGGFRYTVAYDDGDFIHVRVLEGPNQFDLYRCTTRDARGEKHLGPGGGWEGASEINLSSSDLEEIA